MKVEKVDERVVLTADNGMVITDGKSYGRTIYLAVGATEEGFYEITKAEYERIIAEQEPQNIM